MHRLRKTLFRRSFYAHEVEGTKGDSTRMGESRVSGWQDA